VALWLPGLLPLELPDIGLAAPSRIEQEEAVREILYGDGALDEHDIEGAATAARDHPDAPPVEFPDPRLLARAHGISLRPWPTLAVPGAWAPGPRWILYRPELNRRAQGFVVGHELAHAVAPRDATHVDVARLALALLCPRATVVARVRKLGRDGAASWLVARNRHAPTRFLRLRVERVIIAARLA
jgi:hypothetical protein